MKRLVYSFLVGAAVCFNLQAPETFLVGLSSSTPTVLFGGGGGSCNQEGEVAGSPYSNVVQTFGGSSNSTFYKLSQPRAALGAAVVGDLALFAGGQVADKNPLYTNTVDLISLTSGSQTVHTLSQPRGYVTGAATAHSAYFIGGYLNNGGRSTVIDEYNTVQKKWSTLHLDLGRSNHTSLGVSNYVFIGGGIMEMDPIVYTNQVDIIHEDMNSGKATFLEPLFVMGNRSNMASTVINYGGQSMVFLAGGEGPGACCGMGYRCNDEYTYCAAALVNIIFINQSTNVINYTANWTLFGSFEHRSRLATAAAGNVVLFAGGKNISGYSDMVDIYDVTTGNWSTTQLSMPRAHMAAAVSGDGKIYFSGGEGDKGVVDVVDVFDTKTMTWV